MYCNQLTKISTVISPLIRYIWTFPRLEQPCRGPAGRGISSQWKLYIFYVILFPLRHHKLCETCRENKRNKRKWVLLFGPSAFDYYISKQKKQNSFLCPLLAANREKFNKLYFYCVFRLLKCCLYNLKVMISSDL